MKITLKKEKKEKEKKQFIPRTKDPYPLPEAIEANVWDIKKSQNRRHGHVQLHEDGGGSIEMPLGGGAAERAIRLHEQAHIALTPRGKEMWSGVDHMILELCEDRRIHHALELEGFKEELDALKELVPEMKIEWKEIRQKYAVSERKDSKIKAPRSIVAGRVIASYGTGLQEHEMKQAKALDAEAADLGEQLAKHFSGDQIRSFEESREAAKIICKKLGKPVLSTGEKRKVMTLIFKVRGIPGKTTPFPPKDTKRIKPWPKLEIVEKPMPLRMPPILKGRSYKKLPDTSGRTLRRVSRLAQDGRVFRKKMPKKMPGGTVLIDCSGSMSLHPLHIDAIMHVLPTAVIATYAGAGSGGRLWIVARKKRRAKVDDLHPRLGGNVVDVPALEWLCSQKEPRYWISDGGVTEYNDHPTRRCNTECERLETVGNIKRINSVEELIENEGFEIDFGNINYTDIIYDSDVDEYDEEYDDEYEDEDEEE